LIASVAQKLVDLAQIQLTAKPSKMEGVATNKYSMLTRQKKCSIDLLKYNMSCFSKKSIVGTNFASLVTVVTIDYEFWRRLNSEIASGKVAVNEQGIAVNLQSQANGNIYVRKSMLCGNSNQFCFVFGSFTIRSKTS